MKASLILRHAERKHGRIERIRKPRRARSEDEDEPPRKKFRKIVLSDSAKQRIRDRNIEILADGQLKSLGTFGKEVFIARDRQLLTEVGVDPTIADEIAVSRFTTRRDVVDVAENNRRQIGLKLKEVAKKAVLVFHSTIKISEGIM